MHIWAYENPSKADGERFIACEGFGPPQAIADILREEYKGTKIGEKIPVGETGVGYVGYNKETGQVDDINYLPGRIQVSGKKAEKVMGLRWISFQKSVIDTAKALEALL